MSKLTSKKTLKKSTVNAFINYGIIVVAYVVLQILTGADVLSNSLKSLLIPTCCYIIMAISLNLTVGILGELSLGHAGFMSLGAFSGIIVSVALKGVIESDTLRLVFAIIAGALAGAAGGIIVGVPVLRLKGDYLAIVTLAFGEIIKNIIMVLYIGIDENGMHFATKEAELGLAEGGIAIIKGPMGAVGVSKLSTFTSGIVLILITLFVVQNLMNSRSGRAIMALRDNRIAAESIGINVTKYKLMAFAISAALAGAAGALFGLNFSSTVAGKFDFNTSILILVFVVLGGLANIRGSIIAAALLYILPELLRSFDISEYRMFLYAIILIVVMLFTNNAQVKAIIRKIIPGGKEADENVQK